MKISPFLKKTLVATALIALIGLSNSLESQANTPSLTTYSNEDLTTILNNLFKNEFKNNSSIVLNKTVIIYSHDRGLKDTQIVDLSKLNLTDPRIKFYKSDPDSIHLLTINRINYFIKSNKYELSWLFNGGSAGGHSVSYVYKKRKGIFKRWVYRKILGTHWGPVF